MPIQLPSFIVYRSSAGSGKTYSLVRQYLTIALKDPSPAAYMRILAITFTNNAAAEMKDRIVSRLHDFSQMHQLPPTDGAWVLFNEIREMHDMDPLELESRAEKMLSHILHHYSGFAVSTIDSFIHKIVRSFARDLGRHPDFDIEMDMDQVLEEVVDRCLDQVGRDQHITDYLKSLILFQMEDGKSWNPKKIMLDFSKSLVSEKGIQALERQNGLTLSDFTRIRTELVNLLDTLEAPPKAMAKRAFDLLSSCSIDPEDHYYKGKGLYFKLGELSEEVLINQDKNSLMNPTFSGNWPKALEVKWIGKNAGPDVKARFEQVADDVEKEIHALYEWYHSPDLNRCFLIQRILKNFFALGLIHYLHHVAEDLKEEKNFLMIDDFHQMVSKVISENHAPFIYEKVGEKFEHILFDEFQDTSELQWRNFLPLVQECLAKEGSVFVVGDGKQSIYRWRNGNVRQFVELPNIHETPNVAGLAAAMMEHFDEPSRGINYNYRSAENIVTFNNGLFESYKAHLGEHETVYEDHVQEVRGKGKGMVQLNWCADPQQPKELIYTQIIDIINQCRQDGFRLSDITILTRKGKKESGPIAQAIKDYNLQAAPDEKILVSTQDSFLLSLSPKVRLIMAYLVYLTSPKESYFRFDLIRCLAEVFPDTVDRGAFLDECMEHWKEDGKEGYRFADIKSVILKWNQNLRMSWPTGKSAFEMAKAMINAVEMEMDEYVEFLLDQLAQRSKQIGFQPAELKRWWDKAQEKLCINASGVQDAVKMMTIHRSKGLEFPVVIYPRFNGNVPGGFLWMDTSQEQLPIQDALINYKASRPKYYQPADMHKEFWDVQLDDANLIYVAQTRPTQRLYILQEIKEEVAKQETQSLEPPKAKKGKKKEPEPSQEDRSTWGFHDFLWHHMSTHGEEVEKDIWRYGKREAPLAEKKKEEIPSIEMSAKMYQVDEKKLRLSATKKQTMQEIWEKGRWGEQVHVLFQLFVQGWSEEEAIKQLMRSDRSIDEDRKWLLSHEWKKALQDSTMNQFRAMKLQWSIEQPILMADASELRPDLFAWSQERDKIWLVDFKTGKESEKHEQQILGYAQVISEICKAPVQAALLYTQEMIWKNC